MTAPTRPRSGHRRRAEAEAPLHAPRPGDLPGRRPHRGAGRERHRAGRLHPELRRGRASSACTTSWAAGCPARRCSRSASCRTSRPPSSSSSPAASSRRSGRCRRTRRAEEAHPVDPVPHRVSSRSPRPTPSRSSPSRIPGAVANPGFASRLIMVVTLTAGAIFVMWLGEQITERGIGNGDEPAHHLLDPRAALAGRRSQLFSFVQTGVVAPVGAVVVPGHPGRRWSRPSWR